MKNIYTLIIVITTLFSCTNSTPEISEPIIIGSVKNDDGNVKSLTVGDVSNEQIWLDYIKACLLYTSPSPRDRTRSRMPSSA